MLDLNPSRATCPPKAWYMFYYERGGKRPKEYDGPYATKQQANQRVRADFKKYGKPSGRYVIRQLTREQFECVWGAPPQAAAQPIPQFDDNPRRPPKKWFRDCVRGVEASRRRARRTGRRVARDPRAVCGAQWQKMSESERRAAVRRERRLSENPAGFWGKFLG